jgi:GT2 family glycosyltransferase
MNVPLVSVLIPCLNQEKYLENCLDSVLSQTHKHWECIICDGGSDDGSLERIKGFMVKTDRIALHHRKAAGIYDALNFLVEQARGDFYVILPADDFLSPTHLESLSLELSKQAKIGFAHCDLRVVGEGCEIVKRWWQESSPLAKLKQSTSFSRGIIDTKRGFLLHANGYSVYVSLTQLMFRKDCARRVGPFRTDLGSDADFHWLSQASYLLESIYVPATWGGWRLHAGQATTRNFNRNTVERRIELFHLACDDLLALESPNVETIRIAERLSKIDYSVRNLLSPHRGILHRLKFLMHCLLNGRLAAVMYRVRRRNGVSSEEPILGIFQIDDLY